MRCTPKGFGGKRADIDVLKRESWRRHKILAISVEDQRLTWTEQEFISQLGNRLYGIPGRRPS